MAIRPFMSLVDRGQGILDYRVSPGFRLTFLALLFLIVVSIILSGMRAGDSLGPMLLCFVILLGAVFVDTWRFSSRDRRVEHRVGIGPLQRVRAYDLDRLQEVALVPSAPVRSSYDRHTRVPRRGMMFLVLRFVDDESVTFTMDRYANVRQLRDIAVHVARFCSVPLVDELEL